ncbi:MAG: 50S ribosomal protein L5 [Planctomycetes bacterium]|nr:50S ribosomal protein L5 [Planctomycetota bacterium]
MARMLEKYQKEIVPKMKERFGYTNPYEIPKLKKITLNMGVGAAIENKNRIEHAMKDLATIAGQQPVVRKSRKAVAGFKLRENLAIGCMVTLRGKRMYEFLDRIISVVLPRIKDFRGMPKKSFDGRGNYSFGIHEQITFPEINLDQVEFTQGMDVTLTISGNDDEASAELLTLFGFPFRLAK